VAPDGEEAEALDVDETAVIASYLEVTERVVFAANGLVSKSSGAQTYNSGAAGSVAGQYANAEQARWKVANGMLHFSQDGMNWAPQELQVTQNSNGYPILKSGGKEYMRCN